MPIVRQKLTVEKAREPKSFGDRGGQKLEFTCSDGKKWVTFKKSLFQYIIDGAEIDADTETKERPHENGVYIDHIVQEIYIDGKAVGGQAKQRYQDGDSPEKRASIEAQQAADFTTQLWIADKLDADSEEVKGLRLWLLARLRPSVHVSAKAETSKGTETSAVAKPPTKAAVPLAGSGEITLAVPKEGVPEGKPKPKRDPVAIKNYTQLCKACHEDWGMQPNDVLSDLNVNSQSEITQTMPDCYIAIAAAREAPKEQE